MGEPEASWALTQIPDRPLPEVSATVPDIAPPGAKEALMLGVVEPALTGTSVGEVDPEAS